MTDRSQSGYRPRGWASLPGHFLTGRSLLLGFFLFWAWEAKVSPIRPCGVPQAVRFSCPGIIYQSLESSCSSPLMSASGSRTDGDRRSSRGNGRSSDGLSRKGAMLARCHVVPSEHCARKMSDELLHGWQQRGLLRRV